MRAVSEFQRKMNNQPEQHIAIGYDSLLSAYYQCRRNKAWTEAAAAFEIHYEAELLKLRDEIQAGRYRPQPSITFLVEWPTLREVFAAMFGRDMQDLDRTADRTAFRGAVHPGEFQLPQG